MEIVLTFLNNLTQSQIITVASLSGCLVLLIIYRTIIAPKLKHRRVLARVRAIAYKKAQRQVTSDNSFTWGENIDRTNIGAAYVVEEMDAEMNTRLKRVLRDVN